MAGSLAMGVDLGTSSVKVGVFRPGQDRPVGVASEPYVVGPVPANPTWAEVDPDRWRQAMLRAVWQLPEAMRAGVCSLGVTGLFPALIAMDEAGQALRPAILYSDRRSTGVVEELRRRGLYDRLARAGGAEPVPGTTSVLSFLWLREHEPEVDARARWIGHATTWIGAWLTGELAMDRSNASMTGLLDTASGSWSRPIMEELQIAPDRWPPVVDSSRPTGALREEPARLLGLPPGLPVTLAGGDTPCAAVGAGCVDEGDCFLSTGTTDTLCLCMNEYRFEPRLFCAAHALSQRWLSMAPTLYTGGALEWCGRIVGAGTRDAVERVLSLADGVPPGAGGLVFLPYLMGERCPIRDPQARGVLLGLTPASGLPEIARAVVDGGALAIRTCLEALPSAGRVPQTITVVGRPASSELLNRARAAATGTAMVALEFREATILGAAACGAVAGGMVDQHLEITGPYLKRTHRYDPDPEAAKVYEHLLPIYRDLYQALRDKDLFARLP